MAKFRLKINSGIRLSLLDLACWMEHAVIIP